MSAVVILSQINLGSMESKEDHYESKLSKHAYWEENFDLELQNFEDNGDDGEVWFGKDVQRKTVRYIQETYGDAEGLCVLDVGTGNGALLFKLAKKGLKATLVGIDYSEKSILFSKKVQASLCENKPLVSGIEFRFENAFDLLDHNRYDIIHDKGTFDVVVMNKDLDNRAYARAMRHRLNSNNPNAVFILTSCNLTTDEMDEIFVGPDLLQKAG